MLKKIAAYGVIGAAAAGFMLASAPADAQPMPGSDTQNTPGTDGTQSGPGMDSTQNTPGTDSTQSSPLGGLGGDWRPQRPSLRNLFFIRLKKDQTNSANNFLYACDTHAAAALDHQLMGQNQENGKCAQASFNDN